MCMGTTIMILREIIGVCSTMLVSLIHSVPGSSVSESVVTQDTVEVDESLFQDLEDLELEET